MLKEAADAEVVAAVRAVAAGERYVHPALGAKLVAAEAEERTRAPRPIRSPSASARCCACWRSATRTRRSRSMLYISVRTAETHRAHIMQKLRLAIRAELVRYALDQGLIET